MKGLLIKDWYMVKKYCRAYLIITVAFLAMYCFDSDTPFFVLYPSILCGIIPVNIQSLDERSGWSGYSGTLPCTKAQLVSVKYLIGLFVMLAVLAVAGIMGSVKTALSGAPYFGDLPVTLSAMFILAVISAATCLPFIFRFGAEKGRIAYFVAVAALCAVVSVLSVLSDPSVELPAVKINTNLLLVCLLLVGCGLYALSWALSVAFYKNREI